MEVRSIEAVVQALNSANVQYLIVDGLAVNAHGYERLTVDVDLVIGLDRENIIRALHSLTNIDYHMSIPVTPEEFADPHLRAEWRAEKGMVVLKLWSDSHRRTPLDIFIYEPFDFRSEYGRARWEVVAGDTLSPVLSYDALLVMKAAAGRPKDLLDSDALRKLDPYRWRKRSCIPILVGRGAPSRAPTAHAAHRPQHHVPRETRMAGGGGDAHAHPARRTGEGRLKARSGRTDYIAEAGYGRLFALASLTACHPHHE